MRYLKLQNLDAYKLKWIAIIGMFTNHAVLALREVIPLWLQLSLFAIGGVTFPIMAFFVSEGYKHTSNVKKYFLRIFIFALIAQYPFMLALRDFQRLNIMFTISLGLALIVLYDKMQKPVHRYLIFWPLFIVSAVFTIMFDWMIIGLIIMLMYHVISNESRRRTWPSIAAGVFYIVSCLPIAITLIRYGIDNLPQSRDDIAIALPMYSIVNRDVLFVMTFPIGCFLAMYLLKRYNGERGRNMKYLFYLFYPLHLIILASVAYAFGLIEFPGF